MKVRIENKASLIKASLSKGAVPEAIITSLLNVLIFSLSQKSKFYKYKIFKLIQQNRAHFKKSSST